MIKLRYSKGLKDNYKKAGQKLANIRQKLRVSQKELSKYLNVDRTYISKIEKGRRPLTFDIAQKVCSLACCSLSYFSDSCTDEILTLDFVIRDLKAEDLKLIARLNEVALKLKEIEKIMEEHNDRV